MCAGRRAGMGPCIPQGAEPSTPNPQACRVEDSPCMRRHAVSSRVGMHAAVRRTWNKYASRGQNLSHCQCESLQTIQGVPSQLASGALTSARVGIQLLRRNVKRFRGGLIFKAHRLVYHSTLGWRVIKKKKEYTGREGSDLGFDADAADLRALDRIQGTKAIRNLLLRPTRRSPSPLALKNRGRGSAMVAGRGSTGVPRS